MESALTESPGEIAGDMIHLLMRMSDRGALGRSP